jgi:RNA polymerase sigma-70 factor (ECF subfamily)
MADSPHDPSPATDAELLQSGFRHAMALSHRVEDAEDLVQEAWMNLCKTYGRVESRGVLCTAVRNLFIDQCRRRKIVQFDALDDAVIHDTPAAPVNEPGVKGDLDALLATLRPAEREALFLHYYQGHTAEEIGQLTSQPRNTVLSLMHRAIGKLRAAASNPLPKIGNQLAIFFVTFL